MRPRDRLFFPGEYVLATKYNDGDPGDHFAVGFYSHYLISPSGSKILYSPPRHIVIDSNGQPFRANGFRRVEHISLERGKYIVERLKEIEWRGFSVWYWKYRKMTTQ